MIINKPKKQDSKSIYHLHSDWGFRTKLNNETTSLSPIINQKDKDRFNLIEEQLFKLYFDFEGQLLLEPYLELNV